MFAQCQREIQAGHDLGREPLYSLMTMIIGPAIKV